MNELDRLNHKRQDRINRLLRPGSSESLRPAPSSSTAPSIKQKPSVVEPPASSKQPRASSAKGDAKKPAAKPSVLVPVLQARKTKHLNNGSATTAAKGKDNENQTEAPGKDREKGKEKEKEKEKAKAKEKSGPVKRRITQVVQRQQSQVANYVPQNIEEGTSSANLIRRVEEALSSNASELDEDQEADPWLEELQDNSHSQQLVNNVAGEEEEEEEEDGVQEEEEEEEEEDNGNDNEEGEAVTGKKGSAARDEPTLSGGSAFDGMLSLASEPLIPVDPFRRLIRQTGASIARNNAVKELTFRSKAIARMHLAVDQEVAALLWENSPKCLVAPALARSWNTTMKRQLVEAALGLPVANGWPAMSESMQEVAENLKQRLQVLMHALAAAAIQAAQNEGRTTEGDISAASYAPNAEEIVVTVDHVESAVKACIAKRL